VYGALAQERLVELRQEADSAKDSAERAERDPALSVAAGSGQSFRDTLANGQPCPFCPEMVVVPAGRFLMGSKPAEIAELLSEFPADAGWWRAEGPTRSVPIRRAFAIGRYEITFDEWGTCIASGGCPSQSKPNDFGWGKGRHPVTDVSWRDVKEYVSWLSGLTGHQYRLLSEAEWEYAARAGTNTRYAFGNTIDRREAQFSEGALGKAKHTVEVGRFPANSWGIYDMHGNVREWVEDCWHDSYSGAPLDERPWMNCSDANRRVRRGGSWINRSQGVRSADRGADPADLRGHATGFRVARTL